MEPTQGVRLCCGLKDECVDVGMDKIEMQVREVCSFADSHDIMKSELDDKRQEVGDLQDNLKELKKKVEWLEGQVRVQVKGRAYDKRNSGMKREGFIGPSWRDVAYQATLITKKKITSGRRGTYRVVLCVLCVPNAHSLPQPRPVASQPAFTSRTPCLATMSSCGSSSCMYLLNAIVSYNVFLWQLQLHVPPQRSLADSEWVYPYAGFVAKRYSLHQTLILHASSLTHLRPNHSSLLCPQIRLTQCELCPARLQYWFSDLTSDPVYPAALSPHTITFRRRVSHA